MPDYFTTPNLADMGGDIAKREIGTVALTGTYDRP